MQRNRFWLGLISLLVLVGCGIFFVHRYSRWPVPLLPKADSATLTLNLNTDRVTVQQPFQVTVLVQTGKISVNALGLYLKFNPDQIQLVNFDTRPSFCQFYPEKKFDNQTGSISLACGAPHPGFSGSNTVAVLEFVPKVTGKTLIRTAETTQIIASDGKATNMVHVFPQLEVNVQTGW